MEFDNTTHAIWEEMRSGTPFSPPKRDTGPYEEDFYGTDNLEGINFKKLMTFIQQSKTDKTLVFDRKLYETGTTVETYTPSVIKIAPNNVHFEYKNEKGKTVQLPLSGKLNKRIDYLSSDWSYRIAIDPEQEIVKGYLYFYYANTEKHRKRVDDPDFFKILGKYRAIELSTTNLDDFIQLIKVVSENRSPYPRIQKEILLKYDQLLKNEKETKKLIFLYEHLPEFALEDPQFRFDDQLLMDHLYQFKNHDDSNWFQFQDGSGALIQLFRLMSKGETDFLYRVCVNHPQLIRELYYNLDGTSTIDNAPVKNRKAFADMIYMLCVKHNFDKLNKLKKTGHVYRIGGNYFPDSNVNSGTDEHKDKIYLKQYVTKTETVYDYFHGEQHASTDSEDIPLTNGEYYHPLDLVKLIDMNTDDQTPVLVPAILVKCYADEKEWENIEQCIRIGMDILAIILGVITLGATSPLLLVLAVGDIGLTAADLVVALNEDELMQTKQGREFLAAWNKIILVGGIVTAGPLLVRSAFKTGAFLFSKATVAETKNFLRASLIKIVLETNAINFTKSTVKLNTAEEVVRGMLLSPKNTHLINNIHKLQDNGVIFLQGKIDLNGKVLGDQFAAVFEGEIIAYGSGTRLKHSLDSLIKMNPRKVLAGIQKFIRGEGLVVYGKSRFSNFALNHRNTMPMPSHNGNIAVFEFIGKEGKLELKAFPTLEKEEEWIALGFRSKPHAEEIGLDWLRKNEIAEVQHVYSELQPCMLNRHKCKVKIAEEHPHAKVSYSFHFNNKPSVMATAIKLRSQKLDKLINL